MFGPESHPDDYYYIYDKAGRKVFYSKIDNKRKGKTYINPTFIDKIKPRDNVLNVAELLALKDGYLKEIERLKKKISEIDAKMVNAEMPDPETIKKHKEKDEQDMKEVNRRKEEAKRQKQTFFEKLFRDYEQRKSYNTSNNNTQSTSSNNKTTE